MNIDAVLRPAVELYVDLHRHPELAGAEQRTAAALAGRLDRAGYAVLTGIGGHGLVGVLRRGAGPVVLVRTELDALPVAERTGLPYASTEVVEDPRTGRSTPVMHACGHDVHVACVAAAAELLAGDGGWRGTLLVVGQPAEETLTGARAMLADGLYDRVGRPEVVLAQHAAPLPAGMVAHGIGPVLAGSSAVELELTGRGGHAALAHLTVNPIEVAAEVVLRLRDLRVGAAVTVGALHAGARGNVVPDTAMLEVSLRSLDPAALDRAEEAVRRVAGAAATGAGCPEPPRLTVTARSPVTVCDPVAGEQVRVAHVAAFGAERVTGWPPSLATEDVGLFAAAGAELHGGTGIVLAHWMLGTVGPRQWAAAAGTTAGAKLAALPANHSSGYAPDPAPTLRTGITALVAAARTHLAAAAPDP